MKQRLEFREDGSNKFWEISTGGSRITVTFGKLGSAGQTKVKDLESAEAAEASATQQVAEKMKKGYRPAQTPAVPGNPAPRAEAVSDAPVRLPDELSALIGARCFVAGREDENDVVVFDWASFEPAAQQTFLSDLFGDCSATDFPELLSFDGQISWRAPHCVPFALFGVVSGTDAFRGDNAPQFHRLLLLDAGGAAHCIDVDGTAVPAQRPQLLAKSWQALKIKVRAEAPPAGQLPAWKATRRVRLLGSLGEFQAVSRGTPFIHSMMSSADGARAVLTTSSTPDDAARLYDVASGELLRRFGPSSLGVALSPDGKTVVTASGSWSSGPQKHVVAWDADSGQERWRVPAHQDCMYNSVHLAISPDGKTLVTSCDGSGPTLRAFNLETGSELWSATLGTSDMRAEALCFSPDGERLAAGCSDETLQIWDAHAGKRLHRVAHQGTPRGLAWTHDGSRVVTNSSHLIGVWVPGEEKPERVLSEYERARTGGAIVVSSDGFIAGRVDWTQVDLWDLEGKPLERLNLKKKVGVGTLTTCEGGILVGTQADCALRFAITL